MAERWGLSMAGCESAIRRAVRAASACPADPIRYLEIGVAKGDTFARVCEQLAATGRPWDAIGLELPDGIEAAEGYQRAASCFDPDSFAANVAPWPGQTHLVRCPSQVWFASGHVPGPFAVALIDGCHERGCVLADFMDLEPYIAPGGVVIFHDTAPWSQDDPEQIQPHRGQPLQVRQALALLGLLDGTRHGWKLIDEADGARETGGRGCMVFRRA